MSCVVPDTKLQFSTAVPMQILSVLTWSESRETGIGFPITEISFSDFPLTSSST